MSREPEDPRPIWFLAKNLRTHTRLMLSSSAIWEIDQVSEKPQLWRRVPFQPQTVEEFETRKAAEKKKQKPKTDFAICEGEWMYRYQLIEASDSKEDIEKILRAEAKKRGIAEARRSTSSTRVALKYFLAYEEKEQANELTAQKQNQKKADKVAKPDNDQEDLARYLKAKKKASNQKAVTSAMTQVKPPTEGQAKASTSNDHAIASDKLSVGLNSTHEADVLFRGNLHSRGTQTTSDYTVALEMQCRALEKENAELKLKAAAVILYPRKLISGNKCERTCEVDNLKFAVQLEEENKDFVLPENSTYVGNRRCVPNEQLKRIEVHIPLSTRGSLVFAKVTGEDLKYFGLTKKALKYHPTLNLKLIPESAIIATEAIVNAFYWPNGKKPTNEEWRNFWRTQPGENRRIKKESKKRKNGEPENKPPKKKVKSGEYVSDSSDDESLDTAKEKGARQTEDNVKSAGSADKADKEDEVVNVALTDSVVAGIAANVQEDENSAHVEMVVNSEDSDTSDIPKKLADISDVSSDDD